MSILYLIAYWLSVTVVYVWFGANLIALGLGLWAVVDAALRPAEHFVAAGRRSKGFWVAVNAVSVAVVVLTGFSSMFGVMGCVAAAVYLTDVRPALKLYAPIKVRGVIRPIRRNGRSRPDERGGRR